MNTKGVNFQPSKRGQFSAAVDSTYSSPNEGTPHRHDGVMRPFEQASLWNLCVVRRVLRRRCRVCALIRAAWLFFDQSDDRLRCPCHGASLSPTGQLLSHPGPTALAPLPRLEIRDVNGAIEVFGPAEPT
jgi:cytochrome b6-f complex iron-sulfur subunit